MVQSVLEMHVVLEEGREEMIILENDSIALRALLLNYLIDLYIIRLKAFLQMRFFCVIADILQDSRHIHLGVLRKRSKFE